MILIKHLLKTQKKQSELFNNVLIIKKNNYIYERNRPENEIEELTKYDKMLFFLEITKIIFQNNQHLLFTDENTMMIINATNEIKNDDGNFIICLCRAYHPLIKFKEIKKFITRPRQLKKLNPDLAKYYNNKDDKTKFMKTMNEIILVNLMKTCILKN